MLLYTANINLIPPKMSQYFRFLLTSAFFFFLNHSCKVFLSDQGGFFFKALLAITGCLLECYGAFILINVLAPFSYTVKVKEILFHRQEYSKNNNNNPIHYLVSACLTAFPWRCLVNIRIGGLCTNSQMEINRTYNKRWEETLEVF